MKLLINGKVYNTWKSKKVYSYYGNECANVCYYLASNGEYFCKEPFRGRAYIVSRTTIIQLLIQRNEIGKLRKYFPEYILEYV